MKINLLSGAAIFAAASLTSAVLAQHADLSFYSIGSRLATRGFDDATESPLDYQRVFEGEMSLVSGSVFGDEPGFNNPPGIFSSGGTLKSSVRAALRRWTGSGFIATTDRLNVQIFGGAQSVYTPVVDPADPDTDPLDHFDFGIGSSELHEHPDYYLVDSTLAAPGSPGVYLSEFHAEVDVDGLTRSYPFWMVFNYGQSEADHEAAIDYANEFIVPAPGAVPVLAVSGVLAFGRRRR